ncbi:MAG: site-specific integrase [Oscillospiraceae bacterium]|nr:site-specific integrase [Oscillospiraceae bacterium]
MAEKKLYTVTLTLPDGTRKYFRGKTKKEAERKRTEARMKIGMGVDVNCETTVEELSDIWFKLYKQGKLHKRSEESITFILAHYILPVLGKMKVADVKPIHIQQLMNAVSQYSHSTQKKVLQYTRAIFTVAVENGMIVRTPVGSSIKAGGAEAEEKVPLTRAQTDALLKAIEGTRAYPLVMVLLHTGLRIGEALGLMWSDIDFQSGVLSVNRSIVYPTSSGRRGEVNTDLKTKNARRRIPITNELLAVLRDEKEKSASLWVFSMQDGNFLSYDSFRSLWFIVETRQVSKRKGTGKRRELVERTLDFDVHPHLLRHTCITRWFEQGLDLKEIQRMAGHASLDITMRVYTHYMEEERFAATAAKIRGEAAS